jgi:hypothetical protein
LLYHVVHRHTHFGDVIQPRLNLVLHLHSALTTGNAARPGREATASPSNSHARMPILGDRPRRVRSIAERLAVRAIRIEAPASPPRSVVPVVTHRRSDTTGKTDIEPGATAAMTLPRRHERSSQRHENAITAATRGDEATATKDRGGRTAHLEPTRRNDAAPALPDREIERLAGRVIDSIDRRIAAQRERLGRF